MVDLSPKAHRLHILSGILAASLVLLLLVAIPIYSEAPLNQLQSIKKRGYLKVLTINAASTYYRDSTGEDGFEYQLARLFADHLGVGMKIITVDKFTDIYPELMFETGDIAAAGLSRQDGDYANKVMYSDAYHQVKSQVIYRKGFHERPRDLSKIDDGTLEVIDGTSQAYLLRRMEKDYPKLTWFANRDMGTEELIELVETGLVDYALADSQEIALQRRFYPELRIAFEFKFIKQLRWAVKLDEDSSLLDEIDRFLTIVKEDGRLDQLIHRYYSHVAKFNYSDLQTFETHLYDRLPRFRNMFIHTAENQGLDWRLLAAISYQESLWNPKAKSPTGVRGLMMLTQDTARHVGIENRLDPEQSIQGGARYFKEVLDKIPDRIAQPDRTWLALASYNVGYGHLEDARKITESQGGDPDKWIDVKESLPLLGKKKWYKYTEHGYARGWEPVKYVENIRKYYDLLEWEDRQRNPEAPPPPKDVEGLSISPSF